MHLRTVHVAGHVVTQARTISAYADPEQRRKSKMVVGEWDTPIPLTGDLVVPEFPAALLPSPFREFVEQTAHALQTPLDLPGVLVLSVLSAATGGRLEVEARQGWREPMNTFTVVVLPPGERKSAAFSAATRPLFEVEKILIDRTQRDIVEATTRAETTRKTASRKRVEASAVDEPRAREEQLTGAIELALEADAIVVPAVPRLIADDATPEAIANLLATQGGRIAVMSPEGDVFDIMAGRYSGSVNIGVFLKGHAGDELRVDRRGTAPATVERPALTLGLAVQPDVLQAVYDRPGFRGRGLLARILWAIPTSRVGYRSIATTPVDEQVTERYETTTRAIVATLADWTESAVVALTPDAGVLLVAFEERIEPALAASGRLGNLRDWGGKLAGAAVRLAGLLHVATYPSEAWLRPIEAETMASAIDLADYFTSHALAAFDFMGADPVTNDARVLLRWIMDKGDERFTRRDAHRAHQARFAKATEMDPALDLLTDRYWIRVHDVGPRPQEGGRPSIEYDVNPTALG